MAVRMRPCPRSRRRRHRECDAGTLRWSSPRLMRSNDSASAVCGVWLVTPQQVSTVVLVTWPCALAAGAANEEGLADAGERVRRGGPRLFPASVGGRQLAVDGLAGGLGKVAVLRRRGTIVSSTESSGCPWPGTCSGRHACAGRWRSGSQGIGGDGPGEVAELVEQRDRDPDQPSSPVRTVFFDPRGWPSHGRAPRIWT